MGPRTRGALTHQLFAAYARAARVRVLASVMGMEGLGEADRRFMEFATVFERDVVRQDGARSLEQSMAAGWAALAQLPATDLTRLSQAQIAAHIATQRQARQQPGGVHGG